MAGRIKLHTTVDFFDDLFWSRSNGRMDTPDNIDAMLSCVASMGVSRVDWNVDTRFLLQGIEFGGKKNILAYAAGKAHSMGMELYAVIKPFETGGGMPLPHTFPQPGGVSLQNDLSGLTVSVDPLAASNPQMRLKRKPGDSDPGGKIGRIKLVKWSPAETRVKAEHLSIWLGEKNGQLEKFNEPFSFSEKVEFEPVMPPVPSSGHLVERQCRVITLNDFSISEKYRYLFVKCSLAGGKGDFGNRVAQLMEIYNENGEIMPSTPAWSKLPPPPPERCGFPYSEYLEYYKSPEVKEFFADMARIEAASSEYYDFRGRTSTSVGARPLRILDKDGYAGVARGKDEYLQGPLNFIYPEVREHFLGLVDECMRAGVDGIDFRAANHSSAHAERDEYGFNEPVLERCGEKIDRDCVNRVNGDAYTEFLRSAKNMLSESGLKMSVHVNAAMIHPDERRGPQILPPNFEWQWERWIRDGIADMVSLKDLHFLSESQADSVIDKVTRVAKEYGKPVVYIGTNKELRFSQTLDRQYPIKDGQLRNNSRVEFELNRAANDNRIYAYNLYETGSYIRLNENGRVECSPDIAGLTGRFS